MDAMNDPLPALPEGMAELLEEIPLPPLPWDAVGRLSETAERFFATDDRPLPPHRTAPGDLDFIFGEPSPKEGVRYLGLGMRGHGLQSRRLEYLLDAGNLRVALSLPWDQAYGDPGEERERAETAFGLAALCLDRMPEDAFLTVFAGRGAFFWSLTKEGEVLKQGDGADGLLDALDVSDGDAGSRWWLPV